MSDPHREIQPVGAHCKLPPNVVDKAKLAMKKDTLEHSRVRMKFWNYYKYSLNFLF